MGHGLILAISKANEQYWEGRKTMSDVSVFEARKIITMNPSNPFANHI
jgi:hypothetical protein